MKYKTYENVGYYTNIIKKLDNSCNYKMKFFALQVKLSPFPKMISPSVVKAQMRPI